MLLKNIPVSLSSTSSSSSVASGEMAASRHVLHTPMPCRPCPIKSGPHSFPWSVSEHSDWASLTTAHGLGVQLNPLKSNPFLFTNLSPTSQQASPCIQSCQPRQQVEVRSAWPKHSTVSEPFAKEPTRLFRVRSLSELGDSQAIAMERKKMAPIQWRSTGTSQPQRVFGVGQAEGNDGPLDLSERGRSKSNGSANSEQSVFSQGAEGEEKGFESRANSSPHGPPSSSSPVVPTMPSSPPSGQAQELQKSSDHSNTVNIMFLKPRTTIAHLSIQNPHKYKAVIWLSCVFRSKEEEQGQREEKNNIKGDQTNKEEIQVVTISLQPGTEC